MVTAYDFPGRHMVDSPSDPYHFVYGIAYDTAVRLTRGWDRWILVL